MVKNLVKFSLALILSYGFVLANDLSGNLTCEFTKTKKSCEETNTNSISIGTSKALKNKFIIDDKFLKSRKITRDLNRILNNKFKSEKEPNILLDYEIHSFSIEKNHGNFWVDILVNYNLKDAKTAKIIKSQRVAKRYKSKLNKSSEIYKNALDDIANDIYDSIYSNKVIKNKEIKKELLNSQGGVILPFDN